jgi:succinate dehydrogenase / fumarate reductase flavoprotein subunit
VFGRRAGHYAAQFSTEHRVEHIDPAQVDKAAKHAVEPFDRAGTTAENPYAIMHALQDMMQDLVGIVRRGEEMASAIKEIERLRERARHTGVSGNREYNPGWHTALDLEHLLTVSEAIARAALLRTESRGAHFRDDYPAKDDGWGRHNLIVKKDAEGRMQLEKRAIPAMPSELRKIIEEMK